MKLELFYKENCPHCQKVLRFVDQAGLQDHVEKFEVTNDARAAERLASIGGKTQVPCLLIAGKAVYEADEIIRSLKGISGEQGSQLSEEIL